MTRILILPGYGDSGPGHWQTLWEPKLPGAERVNFGSWLHPDADVWGGILATHIRKEKEPCVLVAHSLACLLVALYFEKGGAGNVVGAFLVAPPDPSHPRFPAAIKGFSRLPLDRFPVASMVISSSDDPYSARGFGERCASHWGSSHLELASAGHINVASGYGEWAEGLEYLRRFMREVAP
jgi:predicted alpha/beta hydrolase family esterase